MIILPPIVYLVDDKGFSKQITANVGLEAPDRYILRMLGNSFQLIPGDEISEEKADDSGKRHQEYVFKLKNTSTSQEMKAKGMLQKVFYYVED